MEPLINNLTKNLSGCTGCGKNLGSEEYDFLWKPKEKNEDGSIRNIETDSSGSGDAGGSGIEDG